MGIQRAPRGSLRLGHNSIGLHTVQGVSRCDLLSNGASMDPTGTAMRAGISCPSCWDLGALQCPMVPCGSLRGAGNPKGLWWSR
ncbi:hypothetical protein DV515_00019183 [Chloebia gouldiae]|uniref:Uncharacterized protein n=1 Tax=Chloebia gouldiae TaxID=44316 RepID=A0A3L8Q664_CHLGU|nr:hypothetical protein DV515_00019183 [Chloebia gouldiae]